jgi:hypothetical protein
MKKTLLIAGLTFIGAISNSLHAQAVHNNSDAEQLYSLKPLDENPYCFQSIEERERIVPQKIDELKKLITENQEYPDRVKAFMELICRYENSIIAEVSGVHTFEK